MPDDEELYDSVMHDECLGTIPNSFIMCGEGGNYCSAACEIRASLERAQAGASIMSEDENIFFIGDDADEDDEDEL